jgi:predicted Zn-dependent protease
MLARQKTHCLSAKDVLLQPFVPTRAGRSKVALSLTTMLAAGLVFAPVAVAQADQIFRSWQLNSQTSAPPDTGIPSNLTPQQKYQRDLFLFKKLKEIDELVKGEHYVQSRLMLEDLVTLDPNPYSKDVHGLLAESCYKLGNNPEAVTHYQAAIKYDGDKDCQPYWNIALCYINMNNFDEATRWCKKLLNRNPPADLRRQAERFMNDLSRERSEQQASGSQGDEEGGDYLRHLEATKEANRWPREKLPIKVFIEDDRNVPGFRAQYAAIFLNCLEIWTKATQHKLCFQMVNDVNQADINVVFTANVQDIARFPGQAPAEHGLATVRALTNATAVYGKIEHAKIQLLVHKPSSDKELTDDEMKEVCLHELGHALGLTGHSPADADVMHFMMSFRQLPALSKRDKQTIARLYQDYPSLNQNASANYQPSNMNTDSQTQGQFVPQRFTQQPPQQFQQAPQQFQQSPQQFQQSPQQFQQQPQQFQQQPQQFQQPPQQQFQQPQHYQQFQQPPQQFQQQPAQQFQQQSQQFQQQPQQFQQQPQQNQFQTQQNQFQQQQNQQNVYGQYRPNNN